MKKLSPEQKTKEVRQWPKPQYVSGPLKDPDDAMAKFKWLNDGVVRACIRGASGKADVYVPTAMLIEQLKAGIGFDELETLRSCLDLTMDRLAPMLGFSKATLHRRKDSGRLTSSESDRVVRIALLFGKAVEALENQKNARIWLTTPQFGLGGAIPLEYAETEVGAREVEDLLGRIEHGVYS